jgi:hypothetical protein
MIDPHSFISSQLVPTAADGDDSLISALATVLYVSSIDATNRSKLMKFIRYRVLVEMLHHYTKEPRLAQEFTKVAGVQIEDYVKTMMGGRDVKKTSLGDVKVNDLFMIWTCQAFNVSINLWTPASNLPLRQFQRRISKHAQAVSSSAVNVALMNDDESNLRFAAVVVTDILTPKKSGSSNHGNTPKKSLANEKPTNSPPPTLIPRIAFVLDTNWLRESFKEAKQLLSEFSTETRSVLIPYMLINELENQKHKFANDFKQARSVREALNWIKEQQASEAIEIQQEKNYREIETSQLWFGRRTIVNDEKVSRALCCCCCCCCCFCCYLCI